MENLKLGLELTAEQVAKSVSAAYDSVGLINELVSKAVLTTEETDTLSRNKEHLVIMLAKDFFINALTEEQKAELLAHSI